LPAEATTTNETAWLYQLQKTSQESKTEEMHSTYSLVFHKKLRSCMALTLRKSMNQHKIHKNKKYYVKRESRAMQP
jgi:hypothetical protein